MNAARSAAVLQALPLAYSKIRVELDQRRTRPVRVPTFRGAGLRAQTMTALEWLLSGPADTGKTWSGLWLLDSLLRDHPRSRAGIVRKVRADMPGTVLQTWEQIIAIRGGVAKFGGNNPEFYSYPNGAHVYIGGMDRPGKVLSSERDWIYGNQVEEFALDDWETLSTRTSGRGAITEHPMLFGDCNPGPQHHWIRQRKGLQLLESVHKDNPALYDDDGNPTEQCKQRLGVLENLSGIRRLRLLEGKWASAEGSVYDDFRHSVHVIKRDALPEIVRWFLSIDFGYTNPFVAQLWGADADGRLYLVSEIYRTQRLVQDHAADIKAMIAGRTIEAAVADHDAEDRATLARYGIATTPAFKDVSPGIQAVQARMKTAGDGKPRLFYVEDALIFRDPFLVAAKKPTSTLEEVESYVWPKGVDGKPAKEAPVKENDHGMDAKRYVVAHVDRISDRKGGAWLALIDEAERAKERAA